MKKLINQLFSLLEPKFFSYPVKCGRKQQSVAGDI